MNARTSTLKRALGTPKRNSTRRIQQTKSFGQKSPIKITKLACPIALSNAGMTNSTRDTHAATADRIAGFSLGYVKFAGTHSRRIFIFEKRGGAVIQSRGGFEERDSAELEMKGGNAGVESDDV